jgi:hypothetical protein
MLRYCDIARMNSWQGWLTYGSSGARAAAAAEASFLPAGVHERRYPQYCGEKQFSAGGWAGRFLLLSRVTSLQRGEEEEEEGAGQQRGKEF